MAEQQPLTTGIQEPIADNRETAASTLPGRRSPLVAVGLALVGALAFITLLMLATGTPVGATYALILTGAFSTRANVADAIMLAAPLLLCSAGLTITFAAGLYNLGVEGQIAVGAVCTLLVMRLFPGLPAPVLWTLAFASGALGGVLWAMIAAALKLYGRVSEIFAGLGLNFLSIGLAIYLVVGPWQRPGTASITGTELLPNALWLPTVARLRLAPIAPIVALIAVGLVWFLLTRTHWGLAVRATGLNPVAAERLGVPSTRRLVEGMAVCGALAGIAGAIQVLGVFHQLIPNISSGIGLLALLVVLLVRSDPRWILPVAIAFACFSVGSTQLPLRLNVDSSISGVLQGALVLFALVARGLIRR